MPAALDRRGFARDGHEFGFDLETAAEP